MTLTPKKSLIPACDVGTIEQLKNIVKNTCAIEKIGAYKIGFELALRYGLPKLVSIIREYTDLPIIYDHQKAATDVPFTGKRFAKICKDSGVDMVILFPQAGPVTEQEWIDACKNAALGVIVGGEMTHKAYKTSEGGYITDNAIKLMYINAAKQGITEFVVPGNKIESIRAYRKLLSDYCNPIFYSPGLITQGGDINKAAKFINHLIVGRALYEAKDIARKAKEISALI